MSGCTILVSGLPKDVLKEDLRIYFQNSNTSGGGDIASIEIDDERGEAKVEFVEASGKVLCLLWRFIRKARLV